MSDTRKWFVVDAKEKTVGRLCTEIATILMGKNKPTWTPFLDMGDHVIVINARHVKIKGAKADQKEYHHHTGYPGGIRTVSYRKMLDEKPERIIEMAVQRMLPKTKLGRAMFKKLNVYADGEHPHGAQKPESLEITTK